MIGAHASARPTAPPRWIYSLYIYIQNVIFFTEKAVSFSVLFTLKCLYRDNAKKFTLINLFCKNVMLFTKKYVFDAVYVKSNNITC